MFCERIQTTLLSQQSSDQAAYRAGYSTEDHLLTVTLMTELCNEWRSELWLGLIDFEKAFDTVEHDVLWEVLKDQGLHSDYIDIIKRLYDGQTAYVQAGSSESTISLVAWCEARGSSECFIVHRCDGTMLPLPEKAMGKAQIEGDLVNTLVLSLMIQGTHSPIYASQTTFFCLQTQAQI